MKTTNMKSIRLLLAGAAVFAAVFCFSRPSQAQQNCNTPAFYYFISNATEWALNDNTRLLQINQQEFVTTYDVTETWQTTTGDKAFVIETHTLNQYDSCTRYLSATHALVVPDFASLAVTGDQFTVKYPALGNFRAILTLHSGLELQIVSAP
jgi:hypothetical protein